MKRLLFILILVTSFTYLHAQDTVERYNDFLKRYEYFDSSGDMIGHKKWNSLRKQWEYTNLNKPKQSSKSGYIDPYDTDMLFLIAKEKQARLDYNVRLIEDKTNELLETMIYASKNKNLNESQYKQINTIFANLDKISKTIDASNSNSTRQFISLMNGYIRTVGSW